MRDAWKVRSLRRSLAVVAPLLALSLLSAVPAPALARQPAANEWIGRAVVPKSREFTLKDPRKSAPVKAPADVYHVVQASDKLLLLATPTATGWAPIERVVALEQADSFFGRQIQQNPRDSFPHMMRALVALALHGDLERAVGDLNEASRLSPREPDIYLIRADIWRAMGDHVKALADCESALRLDPKSVSALVLRAAIRTDNQEFDKAITDYTEVIRRDPQVVPAYFGRATAHGESGELDKAIADLTSAIVVNPGLPDAYLLRAAAWKQKGVIDKSLSDLSAALRLDPENAHAYHSRGRLWSEKKEFEKAIEDFSHAIRLEPDNPLGYCDRGSAWKALKSNDSAIADFSEAVRLDARDSDAYCGRGWAWHEKREYAKSLADFGQALRLDPRDACALDGRAWIFATCPNPTYRDGKKAVEVAIEACELTRYKAAYCLETLAAAYAESGDFDSAVKWQTKAIELETDPKETEDYRARLKLFQERTPYRESKP